MIYILERGDYVTLGGRVASQSMLRAGWRPYYGPIPEGRYFKLIDGFLAAVEPEPATNIDLVTGE